MGHNANSKEGGDESPQSELLLAANMNFRRCWLVACWMLVVAAANLAAQEAVDRDQWKRGYNGLAMLCRAANLRIHTDLSAWRRIPPRRSMLIILGATRGLPVDVVRHVRRGGAALVASDQRDVTSLLPWGVVLNRGPHYAAAASDMFRDRADCPVATQLDPDHPVTAGCKSLVTNRPGYLAVRRDWAVTEDPTFGLLAQLPVLRGQPRGFGRRGPALAVALQWRNKARAVCLGDPSIFSNQMLVYGDNAQLAINTLDWLHHDQRRDVLIIADRRVTDPTNPDMLYVLVPPPDPEDVIAALEQLPPEALLDFTNSVIVAVEDEGVVNDVIPDLVDEIPDRLYARTMILLVTIVFFTCLALRLLNRRFHWLDAFSSGGKATRASAQRHEAAALLLDQFRIDLSGSMSTPWGELTRALRVDGDPGNTRRLRREISRTAWRFHRRSQSYWTPRRLAHLRRTVDRWRQLHRGGFLAYDSV